MASLLKRMFEVNFFFSNVLTPVITLAVYFASFAYLSQLFQLEGVNPHFASRMARFLTVVAVGAILIFFIIFKAKQGRRPIFKSSHVRPYFSDFLLLFLPLTPVSQYILSNQEFLSLVETLYVLLFFVIFSCIYIFLLPLLLGMRMPTRTLMISGLAFVFTMTNMALLSDFFAWFEEGALRKQLAVFGAVFLGSWLLYNLNQKKVLYIFIAINFVANSALQLWSQDSGMENSASIMEENKLLLLAREGEPVFTPNIYLLVYDAYVPNETMLGYGIDNRAQEDYLRELGFELYPHTYSIGSTTLGTMSRVLNASTEYYGNVRTAVSGNGIAHQLLRDLDYEIYGLFYSDFMFSGVNESYDFSIPERSLSPSVQLVKSILIGEFRFDIVDMGYGNQTRDQFVASKRSVFKETSEDRVFMYMHSNLPAHSQNSGACLDNEISLFEERLALANLEMQMDLNVITENDPSALVIVAGDHGPYLTKNCYVTTDVYDISEITRLDIQDRHATFLAIKWPTEGFVRYDEIKILQDLFPAIFAYLYQDETILEARIEPVIPVTQSSISGVSVDNGIILGGLDDGEPLFLLNE